MTRIRIRIRFRIRRVLLRKISITNMTQPFFPCTISAQSRNNEFLTIKTVVRKTHQNNGHTGSSCLDKAVLAQGGGGVLITMRRRALHISQHRLLCGTNIAHNSAFREHFERSEECNGLAKRRYA